MNSYQLDYVVEETRRSQPTREQILLRKYLGRRFSKPEADFLWNRIEDHKWFVSERLSRDIGYRVAAIDFLENIYDERSFFGGKRLPAGGFGRILKAVAPIFRFYLRSKGSNLPQ
jgi:hypothetical protein